MRLGNFNKLKINKSVPHGLYLSDEDENLVLLPTKYVPEEYEIGDFLEVFVYLDSEDRPVATNLEPFCAVGDFAYLEVADTSRVGVFLDWGLEKDLLLPFRNQVQSLSVGDMVVVYVYLDKASGRIVATQKLKPWFSYDLHGMQVGDKIEAMVYECSSTTVRLVTTFGQNARIHRVKAQNLQVGDIVTARVANIFDNYLELKIGPSTLEQISTDAQLLLNILADNKGFLGLYDKSSHKLIQKKLA